MAVKKKGSDREKLHCSFCGKEQDSVKRLVAGPGVYICDECIELCNEIIAEESEQETSGTPLGELPKPAEIKAVLDQYAIGQDRAKKALSVAVYNHYKRINENANRKNDIELDKSNILLIGPTGTGKTLLAQTLARILKVPFAIVDATALTEAGYVGEDVENILLKLIQNAENDVKRAEIGIIYIDEIDKISRKTDNPSITRDVSGEGVQQALLKIIEGTEANVPPQGGRKHPHQDFLSIDTKNILFICGGAFVGLEKIIKQRTGRRSIGFSSTDDENTRDIDNRSRSEMLSDILPDDLMKFGLIPEFVGRLPIIAALNNLDKDTLKQIFSEPKNSIRNQYQRIFELENVKLKFTEDAVDKIAEQALNRDAGARGLRSIVEHIMMDLMYEVPSRDDVEQVVITPGVIEKNDPPVITLRKEAKRTKAKPKKEKLA